MNYSKMGKKPKNTYQKELGAYALHAEKYLDIGLPVIPICESGTKAPLVRNWSKFSLETIEKNVEGWKSCHPKANMALITGEASNIVVVDIDENIALEHIWAEFGDSDVYVKTARGWHVYYRYSEGIKTIKGYMGRKVDILSGGAMATLPPSMRECGLEYQYKGESLLNTPHLSAIKIKGSVSLLNHKVKEGERNNTLYKHLCGFIYSEEVSHSFFLEHALSVNLSFQNPLEEYEVRSIVQSVWKGHLAGNVYPPEMQRAVLSLPFIKEPSLKPQDKVLMAYLKASHDGLREEVVISQVAVAKSTNMGVKQVCRSIERLKYTGYLKQTYKGRGKGNPHRYKIVRFDL